MRRLSCSLRPEAGDWRTALHIRRPVDVPAVTNSCRYETYHQLAGISGHQLSFRVRRAGPRPSCRFGRERGSACDSSSPRQRPARSVACPTEPLGIGLVEHLTDACEKFEVLEGFALLE